jgi:DNA mismatch endonuclease, patch repair protein
MIDVMSREQRSALMGRVSGKNTKPELQVRLIIHGLGYRFRLHRSDLPGSPDIVLPSRRKVIFVHGCFWHRHAGCPYATFPKTRVAFWRTKFDANRKRDRRVLRKLKATGWGSLIIWTCEIRDELRLRRKLIRFLERKSGTR